MKIKVLVTGCGGDIGQSIGKILNGCDFIEKLIGTDISDKNASIFIYNTFTKGIPCSNPAYLATLKKMVEENEIDVVIPVSEPELRFFSKNKIERKIGNASILTVSQMAMEVGFDKLSTAIFLKEQGLPYPETRDLDLIESAGNLPVILKSRTGSGSSKVYVVHDEEEFYFIKKRNKGFIAQDYLDEGEGEYTCGLFRSKAGIARTIIFKRELLGGFSGYGEVINNEAINSLLTKIADGLNLVGSINVQLRLNNKGPIVFEINPRFSSTVLFRHMFGFEDLIWSLNDLVNMPLPEYNPDSVGKKFYKGFSEYIK